MSFPYVSIGVWGAGAQGRIQDFGKGGRVQVTVKYYNVALSRVTFFSLFMKFRGGGVLTPRTPPPGSAPGVCGPTAGVDPGGSWGSEHPPTPFIRTPKVYKGGKPSSPNPVSTHWDNMAQMAFCDLPHTFYKLVTNIS